MYLVCMMFHTDFFTEKQAHKWLVKHNMMDPNYIKPKISGNYLQYFYDETVDTTTCLITNITEGVIFLSKQEEQYRLF